MDFEQHRRALGNDVSHTRGQAVLGAGRGYFGALRFQTVPPLAEAKGRGLSPVDSPVFTEALTSKTAGVEGLVLELPNGPHSPWLNLVRSAAHGVEKGEQGGDEGSAGP